MKKDQIKKTLNRVFELHKDKILFAYLFGSIAVNKELKLSDIDIAVYLSNEFIDSHFDIKLRIYADISKLLKRNDIDIVVLNSCKNLILLDEIIRNGVIVFERPNEIRDMFELKTIHMAIDFKHQRKSIMGI